MTHLFTEQAKLHPGKVPLTDEQKTQVPDVQHPLVRVHPATGRRSLLLGDMIISLIVGMSSCESTGLLNALHAHATQPRYVYRHQWTGGDLVIWDNHATMHSATPCDHHRFPRLLYRTTIAA
jgi:taurine dioxygenase